MNQLRQQFVAEKAEAHRRKTQLAAEDALREAAKQAELLAAQQRALALASMTVQGKLIESLRQKCEDWFKHRPPNGNYRVQEANIGKAGLFQEANKLVTHALTGSDWTAADKKELADMLDEWLPKAVAPWGKDERKKLKLSALRGLGQ